MALDDQARAHLGGGGVEEHRVVLVGQRLVEAGGEAGDAVGLGEVGQLLLVAADQNGIGHDAIAIGERHAALFANGRDGADEVLVHAHAPGDAVHHDAEPLFSHVRYLLALQLGVWTISVFRCAGTFRTAHVESAAAVFRSNSLRQDE